MTSACDLVSEYADGELDGEAAEGFRDHLATCLACREELHDVLQLDALVATSLRAARVVGGSRWDVRRSRRAYAMGALLAAAVVACAWLAVRPAGPYPRLAGVTATTATTTIAAVAWPLAPTRATRARLAHPAVAAHRPLEMMRAAGDAPERIATELLAELERRGDMHGAAVGRFLAGERVAAASALAALPPSAEVLSDRAAIALEAGDAQGALRLLDAALAMAPAHGAARWNRALALEALGLPRAAAAELHAVAALDEAGWAAEAAVRAGDLVGAADASRDAWLAAISTWGPALAAGEGTPTVEEVRAQPGLARLYYYEALRAGVRPAAVARLLDELHGTTVLAGWLEAGQARRHRDLVMLGVLVTSGPDGRSVPLRDLPRFQTLAARVNDPWFELLAAEQTGRALREAGRHAEAEVVLAAARERCAAHPIDYRCARIEWELGEVLLTLHRTDEARAVIASALGRARRGGDWSAEASLLAQRAELAATDDDTSPAAMTDAAPFLTELELREPERCAVRVFAGELRAGLLVNQRRHEEAAEAFAAARAAPCAGEPHTLAGLFVAAQALEPETSSEGRQRRHDLLASARELGDAADTAGDRALAEHVAARLLLPEDPVAARAALTRSLALAGAAPAGDVTADKVRRYGAALLAVMAARREAWPEMVAAVADELAVAAPTRCAVVIAVDRETAIAVVGADGSTRGHVRSTPAVDGPLVLAASELHALDACDVVDVLARPPVQGVARLLPRHLAWRYRLGPTASHPTAGGVLVVTQPEPPRELGLARLDSDPLAPEGASVLRGAAATPARVLAAMGDAGWIEIHAHGLAGGELALSPDAAGRFTLTARDLGAARLEHGPVIVLAACHAGRGAAHFHEAWGLPLALRRAGARAVLASPAPLPDARVAAWIAILRSRARPHVPLAVTLRDLRIQSPPGWADDIILFE